jgi:sugar/nucleoside kinase (ribokinase family)
VSVPTGGCEVLVVGPYFADLIFGGFSRPVLPGTEVFAKAFNLLPGGAFTLAIGLRRLGHDVVWATDFGNDVFSREVLALARDEGLDETGFRHHDVPLRSITVALSYPDDRAMVTYQDSVCSAALADVVVEHRPRVLMLPLLKYDMATYGGLRAARELGSQVFMDSQDVAGTLATPLLRDTLALVDVFAPNADEALRLTSATTVDDALRVLANLVDTVVVTRGADGATVVQGGRRCDVAGVSLGVVDTTGAGDCFNVGFMHARLSGWPLADCVVAGVACGAAAITGPGSSAAPYLAELDQWLSRVPRPQQEAIQRQHP